MHCIKVRVSAVLSLYMCCDVSDRYKGESVVKGSPEKVWECLKPVPNGLRVKWDNNVKKFELVEQVTEVG